MAKEQFNVSLPTEVIAMVTRMTTTDRGMISKSDFIETLIRKADKETQPQKHIEAIRDGNKLIGWRARYGDHIVGEFDGAASKPQAERALDAFVYEELSK